MCLNEHSYFSSNKAPIFNIWFSVWSFSTSAFLEEKLSTEKIDGHTHTRALSLVKTDTKGLICTGVICIHVLTLTDSIDVTKDTADFFFF